MRFLVAALLVSLPLPAQQGSVTDLACPVCHVNESGTQPSTGMAHSLSTGDDGEILRAHSVLTFRQGPYSYTIERKGTQSIYRVTDGREEFSAPIAWAFGLGAAGQTYLLNRGGVWYEGRVSFYRDTGNLDLTVGAQPGVPRTLEDAIGRELSKKGAEECFNCHATGAVSGGNLRMESLRPGVQCERCHENASTHVARATFPAKLGNMSSEETADFCGQCHRTWATIASQGPNNITNVRFQPYRLVNSKCYDAADVRIRCTTCHDPHDTSARPVAFYDAKCQSCHAPSGKPGARVCTVAKSGCVSCHMPKVEIPAAHNKFTDHWIRIARAGVPPPV